MRRHSRTGRAKCVGGLLLSGALCALAAASYAQVANPFGVSRPSDPDAKLLLEADRIVYDIERQTVTAEGSVRIAYNGYSLVTERVIYDQRTGQLMAVGGARLLQPDGTVITAREIDVTDDFRDGFIESLNVLGPENTRFAALAAEREDGDTIFYKGVYTACEPCRSGERKAPQFQIKAQKIVIDQDDEVVRYRNARFELFGVPILYTPYFFHALPSAERKSGFLAPRIRVEDDGGIGISAPYYFNLAPSYDATLTPTVWTRQGLMLEGEFRQRLVNGAYTIRAAGIRQLDPDAFDEPPAQENFRGSLEAEGRFLLTPQWTLGFDVAATSDELFTRDYGIDGLDVSEHVSSVYLTGLSSRNYLDLRAMYFNILRYDPQPEYLVEPSGAFARGPGDALIASGETHSLQSEQAIVHPVVDHAYVSDRELFGGELSANTNLTSLSRDERAVEASALCAVRLGGETIEECLERFDDDVPRNIDRTIGFPGTFTRLSSRLDWRREFVAPAGQLVTPFAYLEGRANVLDVDEPVFEIEDGVEAELMPAVGLNYRWPFLITSGGATQTIAPTAMIVARPDEGDVGDIPNDDAQSLFFDETLLFRHDKFSGYDRIEGGVRADVGLTYQATFAGGATIDALVGQSFHIAGENSFEKSDPANVGQESGLEDDVSDYVGRVSLQANPFFNVSARGRLDHEDLSFEHGELLSTLNYRRASISLGYSYLDDQPLAGIFEERQEVFASGSIRFAEHWTASASARYDIENTSLISDSIGILYQDECLSFGLTYSETRERYADEDDEAGRSIGVRIGFRTLGETGFSSGSSDALTGSFR